MTRSACSVVHSITRNELKTVKGGVVGASIAVIEFTMPTVTSDCEDDSQSEEMIPKFLTRAAPLVMCRHHTIMSYHLLKHEEATSHMGSTTTSYKAIQFQPPTSPMSPRPNATFNSLERTRWYIILEFASRVGAPGTREKRIHVHGLLQGQLVSQGAELISGGVYELICSASS